MSLRQITATTLAVLAAGPSLADGHAATAGYVLAQGGSSLAVMPDISAPDSAMVHMLETPLRAIAWRPVTGELLGIGDGAVFTIDPATGAMTDLGASFVGDAALANGAMGGLDFNNAIDAVRAVSTAGDNLVYFPEGFGDNDERAGTVRRFTGLAYAAGDANEAATPMVFANAYTNAISGMTASGTAQFALDAATDALVTLANNEGTLATVGPITVDGMAMDVSAMGGFDIVSPEEGTDRAYAILQAEGATTAGLYAIDLSTGEATMLADLGMDGISGFAASLGGM
ncbi:DUF4394 domain-containing protein [Roseibacterium sp. SDUM158016]|uniref:DUF4394 domain-containing protein n=1 Tax=Roseicyclus sediminis TaxID=2980997 RepID=UPI0021D1DA98|nr:DUF4394 domain-containing protein [Roseibacterium sp. SDUM158016]MCU4652362.1 DUF4394 domain-containing protein [Roseibacterium sp. SDUM158016]